MNNNINESIYLMIDSKLSNQTTNPEEIEKFIEIMWGKTIPEDWYWEIVDLENNKHGYFNNPKLALENIIKLSDNPDCPAVYMTMNPVGSYYISEEINSKAINKILPYEKRTADTHIMRRSRIVIDIDRVTKTQNATTEELLDCRETKVKAVATYLRECGWGEPVIGCSGNGWHLIYMIDMYVGEKSNKVFENFFDSLSNKFSDEIYSIDVTMKNLARLTKVFGTVARKFENKEEAPWRTAFFDLIPESITTISKDNIVSATAIKERKMNSNSVNDEMEHFGKYTQREVEIAMEAAGYNYEQPVQKLGGLFWQTQCPQNDQHKSAGFFLINGVISYKCFHNSCQNLKGKGFSMLKEYLPKKNPQKDGKNKIDTTAIAKEIVESYENKIIHLDNTDYHYLGNCYEVEKDLEMDIRKYFLEKNIPQSNSIISNVANISRAIVHTKGEMPFWRGDCPFKDKNNIIPFNNYLYEITTGRIIKHSPDWISENVLDYNHNPNADCPIWLNFLDQVFEGDPERIALLQEWFGYCLTPDTHLQKILWELGKPGAGKGTISFVQSLLVGKRNFVAYNLEMLATQFGKACLMGKTNAFVTEFELNRQDSKAILEGLKSISGEDQQNISIKFKENQTLKLNVRFTISSNTAPRLLDSSGALARRIIWLPFQRTFEQAPDSKLRDKLAAEIEGIANWAIAGLQRLRQNDDKFTVGALSQSVAKSFNNQSAPIIGWLKSNCLVHNSINSGDLPASCCIEEKIKTRCGSFFPSFEKFCNLHDILPPHETWFHRDLKTALPKLETKQCREPLTGERYRVYEGLSLRPIED